MISVIKPYSYDNGVARLGYDPIKDFEDVFPLKKLTALPPLRAINHTIDIIDDAAYKAIQPRRFKPTEAFLPQLRDKIDAEEQTERVYAAQDSSACSIFMIKKYDKPNEARFISQKKLAPGIFGLARRASSRLIYHFRHVTFYSSSPHISRPVLPLLTSASLCAS